MSVKTIDVVPYYYDTKYRVQLDIVALEPNGFNKIIIELDLPNEPALAVHARHNETKAWTWQNDEIIVKTNTNPITGVNAPGYISDQIDYASHVVLYADKLGTIKKAIKAFILNATYIKAFDSWTYDDSFNVEDDFMSLDVKKQLINSSEFLKFVLEKDVFRE